MIKKLLQICALPFNVTGLAIFLSSGVNAQDLARSVGQIQNQAEPGSGFFLKVGDKTVFITAKHVLGSSGEKAILSLQDGDRLEIPLEDQVPIKDLDSSIVIIKNIPRDIVPLEVSNKRLEPTESLSVWGFPVSESSVAGQLDSRSGPFLGKPSLIRDGYSLLYGAQTQIGFSGGPILDDLGKVVGMHGRSESIKSPNGLLIRTGKALGIPIEAILAAASSPSQTVQKIDEKALAAEAARASMKRVYEIMTNSALSDQLLEELKRAEKSGIPKYCTEISRAYYYIFFSPLPDLSKASLSLTISKKMDGVDPVYYALGSLVSRKSADYKRLLTYDRALEQIGKSSYLQYSDRRLKSEVQSAVDRCSKL